MPRLPTPGSDDGTWGDILNDFLTTQHNADGTHSLTLGNLTNVNTTGATSGQVLKFNGTTWIADTDATGGGDPTMGGDLSGTASNAQIVASAITDTEVSATAAIAQSKIANLTTDLAAKVDDTEKGAASGIATLDSGTKVPIAQLPDATTTTKGIVQLVRVISQVLRPHRRFLGFQER